MENAEFIKQCEKRLAEITAAGWECCDTEADKLLMERKKIHAELTERCPEYFACAQGRIRYAVR